MKDRPAFINSRRGFALGLAALSVPCFVAVSQGHLSLLSTQQARQDGIVVALLGSSLLFVIGSVAFSFLKSASSALGRTMGAFLVRCSIIVLAEVSFIFLAYLSLYFFVPIALAGVASLAHHMENYFSVALIGMAGSSRFFTWQRSVGDLFVPTLVIMVLWTEVYFGFLSPPTKV